jgi:virginiamycin B lyase
MRYRSVGTRVVQITSLSFLLLLCAAALKPWLSHPSVEPPPSLSGSASDNQGRPLPGTMITAKHSQTHIGKTVFTDNAGRYAIPELSPGTYSLRAHKIGFDDQIVDALELTASSNKEFRLLSKEDFSNQMPASEWFATIPFSSPAEREQFKLDCMVCHQIGSPQTRKIRDEQQWAGVIKAMRALYAQAAETPAAIQTDKRRIEILSAWSKANKPHFKLPPTVTGEAARAIITEFDIGREDSYCHDLEVDRHGIVWVVDIGQDALYRMDPRTGKKTSYQIPAGDSQKIPWSYSGYNTHVGPHSIEADEQGRLWITLAFGNKLAMFDPATESFRTFTVPAPGVYPHTLRVAKDGTVWFTLYISGHIGKFDPKTERFTLYTPPTPGGTHYGIAIGPDGMVWYSQLYGQRIGRVDPQTGSITEFKTPGLGPRRLEVDSKGIVWIPEYGAGLLARFDPAMKAFKEYPLPTGTSGEAPYALGIDRDDNIWICGTISDTIMKFDPTTSKFTVIPMPEGVTFTREIEFDYSATPMTVWSINSNDPPTHIEGKQPRLISLQLR